MKLMKLKKEKMPSKKYVLKEKKKVKRENRKLVDVKIINNSTRNNSDIKKEKNNIIEELYKEKVYKDSPKFTVNIEEDDGVSNLEKKLCFQYEQELLEDEKLNSSNAVIQNDDSNIKVNSKEFVNEDIETSKDTKKSMDNKIEVKTVEEKINNSDIEEEGNKENAKNVEDRNEENITESENIKKEKTNFLENIVIKKLISMYKAIFSHPEDVENSFSTWFDSNKKFAFLTALIVGIITHITFLTEMIMSPDGLWNSICYFEADNWEASLGRWGLFISNKIVNNMAVPNLTGVVSIVLVAISVLFIVDILKLKNKITIFIVSAAMVVSPALSGTLLYMYTSVSYCLAMILSVLTVKLIFKEKYKVFNFILAIAIFTFSLGIYQSYIGVTVGLTAIRLIRDLYDKNVKIKWFFIHGIMMCVIVIVGGLLYSRITENVLEKMQLVASEYKGMESISVENTLNSLDKSIPKIYDEFKEFYLGDSIVVNSNYSRQDFYKLMFGAAVILELILIISSGVWKNPFRVLFIIFMNIILPIALNVVLLLTTETSTYILTSAQLLLIIPFVAIICEMSGKKGTFIFKWSAIVGMFLVVFTYYLADNVSYTALKLTYNQAHSTSIRIMDRIEETEGYSPEKPIMIAGIIDHNGPQFYRSSDIYLYTLGTIFDLPVFHGTYSGMEGTWKRFFGNFLGMRINFTNEITYNDVINSEEFKQMGIFPAPNSCKEIYGTMVVKLSDTPPMP